MDTTDKSASRPAKKTSTAPRSEGWSSVEGEFAQETAYRAEALLGLQRLSAIVEGSDDAIISKNLKGAVTTWNAGATRIFGYTAQEMVGRPIATIIPADLLDEEAEILAKLTRGERIDHFDTVRLTKGGDRVDISLTVSPLRDAAGNVVGASKIARDISHRKKIERELREANEALRDASAAAEQLRLEAESANRAKSEFLAVMSHEIRTPLNSIRGFVDLLANSTTLTPQQGRYVHLVRTATAALMTVVNDILDFSKVEAGELELERLPFSLGKLVRDTAAIIAPAAREKTLEMRVSIDPGTPDLIEGDHARLRQVLLNLLNNAIKFTESGSIDVEVRPQSRAGDSGQVYFSVTDTGVGVPVERQDHLFKRFSQADNSVSRRHGGTGLGLAICKQLVDLMDGEIGIVSEVGQGSTVWFTAFLPRASLPTPEPASEKVPETAGAGDARILVVDDIDTNLEIVEAYLRDSGYRVDCVSSGFDALQLLSCTHFDLILMDVQMPVMDGVTATKRIRALPAPIGDVPIIAMTGNVLPQQVRSFLSAGMNDHIGKPIDRVRLCNNIRRWLPGASSGRADAARSSSHFNSAAFDDFVVFIGREKVRQIVNKFQERLSQAFATTFAEAQPEAHGFINVAGLLGLESLVTACRQVSELAPSQGPERAREAMNDLQRARVIALQMISKRILPKLLGSPLAFSHLSA